MKTILQIRNELGLSQNAMALLLGISRSKLVSAEQGTRDLPQKAMDYLEKIEQVLSKSASYEPTDKELEFYRLALAHLLRQAESRQKVLIQKVSATERIQQAKIVRLHVLDCLASDPESPYPDTTLVHQATFYQAVELEEQLKANDRKLNVVYFEIEGIKAELQRLPQRR